MTCEGARLRAERISDAALPLPNRGQVEMATGRNPVHVHAVKSQRLARLAAFGRPGGRAHEIGVGGRVVARGEDFRLLVLGSM